MSKFREIERAYINWREGRDIPPQQTTGHGSAPADNEAVNEVKDQAGTTPGQRWGKRCRRRCRSRGKNRNQQGRTLAGQDQTQQTAELLAMTPTEREAATIHFWTNATPATLFGFSSNAEILATNVANETLNRSTAEPLFQTDYYQEVHRPVEESESPFDLDMSYPRSTAILSGFVERRQDVGKKRKDWVKERYIFADEVEELVMKEEEEREKVKNNTTNGQIGGQKELTPNGTKKWDWYGKKLRKDAARDAKKAAKRQAVEKGGVSSRRSNPVSSGRDRKPPGDIEAGSAGYDHGGFQDTDDFYAEPAPELKNFDPEAMVFEPGRKPGGGWGSFRREIEPEDEMG